MSELIVIGYDNAVDARGAYDQVASLHGDYVVQLRGLAIVTVDEEGKMHVDTPQRAVASSAMSGAIWGLLFGVLFLVPGLGLLGGALGAVFGKLGQSGIDDRFRSQVQQMLKPGGAAVVIMADKVTEDKFATAMKPFGGTILKSSLSEAVEKELAESMA